MTEMHRVDVEVWKQQLAPLADAAQTTQQLLGEIEAPLADLYNQAESTGDTHSLAQVMQVWEKSQAIAAQIPAFVTVIKSGSATIAELRQQRDDFAQELKTLTDAIQSVDARDPRLAHMLEMFEETVRDDLYAEAYEDAMDYASDIIADNAYDEVYDQLYGEIITTFGVSHQAAFRFVAALTGDKAELDDQRRPLFEALLALFEAES